MDQAEITRAYHELAARYHPDKHQGNELEELAQEKLAELNKAHSVLSRPETRANYDAARRGVSPHPAGRPSSAASVPSRRGIFGTFRSILIIMLIFAALPYIFRIFKNPKSLLVIAVAIGIAWWGPRIVRYFKKK